LDISILAPQIFPKFSFLEGRNCRDAGHDKTKVPSPTRLRIGRLKGVTLASSIHEGQQRARNNGAFRIEIAPNFCGFLCVT
jgi:hypothetical protein